MTPEEEADIMKALLAAKGQLDEKEIPKDLQWFGPGIGEPE